MSENDSEYDPETTYSCIGCKQPDSVEDLVQCNQCTAWWHYTCANVTAAVADVSNWVCANCLPPHPVPSASMRTPSSSRRALLDISLKRLAEEKELRKRQLEIDVENQFMAEKYKLLEQSVLEEDSESRSARSRVDENETHDRVQNICEWIKSTSSQQVENVPTKTNAPYNTALEIVDNENIGTTEEGAVGGTTAVICSSRNLPKPIELNIDLAEKQTKIIAGDKTSRGRKIKALPKQTASKSDKPLKMNVKEECEKLKAQLLRCQEDSRRDRQQLKSLQEQFEKCKLQLQSNAVEEKELQIAAPINDALGDIVHKAKLPLPGESVKVRSASNEANSTTRRCKEKSPLLQSRDHNAIKVTQMIDCGTQEQQRVNLARSTEICATSTPQPQSSNDQSVITRVLQAHRPTPEQLASRQVMPRDLPEFSGDVETYPMFVSSFNNSTATCGYSNVENLARLQRCLKGDALRSVRYILLDPESVPEVMRTLRTLYGRPEMIIANLIKNVRECPSPKFDRLETLIDFGLAVRNLVSHLIVTEQQSHLSNPVLLQELVEKLPANVKLQWAQHLSVFPVVTLETFGEFMSSIVESVSKVVVYKSGRNAPSDKSKVKEKGFMHSHAEVANISPDSNGSRVNVKVCPVCSKAHRVIECDAFKRATIDSRWQTVSSKKLCRCCLGQHGRRACRYFMRCGIDGCKLRHHPLLHSKAREINKNSTQNSAENHTYHHSNQSVLFRVLPVTLRGPLKTINTFAFLDEGSSATLVEQSLVEELGVQGPVVPLCLKWTADVFRSEENSQVVTLDVSEVGSQKKYRLGNARTVTHLNLPIQTLCFEELQEKYAHLNGLPIRSYKEAVPQLLIGLRDLSLAVPLRVREGSEGPIAVKTRIGWCVYGSLTAHHETNVSLYRD